MLAGNPVPADDVGQGKTAIAVPVLRTPVGLRALLRGGYAPKELQHLQSELAPIGSNCGPVPRYLWHWQRGGVE